MEESPDKNYGNSVYESPNTKRNLIQEQEDNQTNFDITESKNN